MPISLFDITKGIDFTALVSAAAADHNTLVDGAVPYATDKGIVMMSNDTALNTPDVPNAAVTTKWKNYLWIRRPHSTATPASALIPIVYSWNENRATSDATYLKWERVPADTIAVEALIAALTLRVADLEAVNVTNTALINAANSNAATALTNSSNALSVANAANANALQALSDLDTPTTGVKDRLTAVEADVASAESNITALQTSVTNINNTLGSGLGPIFIAPVNIYTGAGALAFTTFNLPAAVPVAAKAVIIQTDIEGYADVVTVLLRASAVAASYIAGRASSKTAVACCTSQQGQYPFTAGAPGTLQISVTGVSSVATNVNVVGYVL